MRVLVTFAVDAEFAPWRKLRKFRSCVLSASHWSGGVRVHEAEVGGHTVWVYLTGMGIKSFDFKCAICAKAAGAEAVVSSGLAGSLNSTYSALSVIAPRHVGMLRHAMGLGVTRGLLELAEQKGATLVDGLLTSDRIIDSREEKERLSQFADVVDMESFHVVQAFIEEKIPVGVIRAISDGSEEEMPVDFDKCLKVDGSVKVMPLLRDLAKQPSKLPALIRFSRQSHAAAEKLARFLDSYVLSLTSEMLKERGVEAVTE